MVLIAIILAVVVFLAVGIANNVDRYHRDKNHLR